MMPVAFIETLQALRLLRPIDIQAARLIARIDRDQCHEVPILAALASWASGQGHTCLPLSAAPDLLAGADVEITPLSSPETLRTHLLASPAIGQPGAVRPLILDDSNNLYLYRLFRAEEEVAKALRQRAATINTPVGPNVLPVLSQLFPDSSGADAIDWQRAAAALALFRRFLVISGGAGTGKTHTAARILALLTSLTPSPLRIALAAPTGKAALRLQESIRTAKATLSRSMAEQIPEQAQTLHRLLGFQSHCAEFLHNRANPLHLDLLLLDEASMIDVPLMAATLSALPATCRLILLGDQDQLASVEAGNLFGDLCGEGAIRWSARLRDRLQPLLGSALLPGSADESAEPLADSLIKLQISRRFSRESGISALAQAVQTGTTEALEAVLHGCYPDLHIASCDRSPSTWLQERIAPFILPLLTADSPQAALQKLTDHRILCALREGPAGVEGVNRVAETLCRRHGHIPHGERLYRGMPVLILRNAYNLGLFNGDTGVLWPDDSGVLQAWFPLADGQLKSFGLGRLPAWQTSYALTVHKSQGSEFTQVLLLLPQEDMPLLSRELLYTGITRARTELTLCCRPELLRLVSQRRLVRFSGLRNKLRQAESPSTLAADAFSEPLSVAVPPSPHR